MVLLAVVVKTKIPDLPFLHYAIKNLFFQTLFIFLQKGILLEICLNSNLGIIHIRAFPE